MNIKENIKALRTRHGVKGDNIIYRQGFFRVGKDIVRKLTLWFEHEKSFEVYRVDNMQLLQNSLKGVYYGNG